MPTLLHNVLALVAGILFGGGVNAAIVTLSPTRIPPPAAPGWFIALDLVAAYLPMAWLSVQIGRRGPWSRHR